MRLSTNVYGTCELLLNACLTSPDLTVSIAVIGFRVWTSNRLLRHTGVLGDGRSLLVSPAHLPHQIEF